MEILQLRYFCDAAVTENFSATARRFDVPPSDISQSVKRLERELNSNLFVRHANRVSLTPQGRAFFEKVNEALLLLEEGKALYTADADKQTLHIAVNTHRRIVMQTITVFQGRYPGSDIVVKSGVDVQASDYDLIITSDPPTAPCLWGEKLLSEDILLAMNREYPLAGKEDLVVRDLETHPFITMGEHNSIHRITHQICGEYGFVPRVAIQSDDPFYVRKCVELGLGVAFVPVLSWRGQFPENIVFRRVGNYVRDTFVYVDKRRGNIPTVERFINLLKEECQREMQNASKETQ